MSDLEYLVVLNPIDARKHKYDLTNSDLRVGAILLFRSVWIWGYLRAKTEIGYSPIGFVRCGRSACRIAKMNWKIGKETGGKKMEDPHSLKSNEMAEVPVGGLIF